MAIIVYWLRKIYKHIQDTSYEARKPDTMVH